MNDKLLELRRRLLDIYDLTMTAAVLRWDQNTYMPPGGAPARGRQLAMLGRLAHEQLVDPEVGRLLDALEREARPADSDEAALLRVTRRDFDRARRVPTAFVAEMDEHHSNSFQAWTVARPRNDFATMRPLLEKTLELSRRFSEFFPGFAHVADPLIDFADEGMTTSSVRAVFSELRARLVPLVGAITRRPPADDACERQPIAADRQLAFGLEVIRALGYDFERGRQDLTHHPFMTKFSLGDVRITTRVKENAFGDALFGTMHEAGHAMYEQGIRSDFEGTPLASGVSAGVHESQSRLWENLVGRSRPFWEHFYPKLQTHIPEIYKSVPLDVFYRAINKVERSRIRVDADEVTYNLHVMLRFDLEVEMLEGRLAVKDLPEAWRARMQSDLGMNVPDDRDGAMQDVHWYGGPVGGVFQGYTLGNIMSAQLYAAAVRAHPSIPAEVGQGRFATLLAWLREHVHQHGAKYRPQELLTRATGEPMTVEPYMTYLQGKYQPLYGIAAEDLAPVR